MSSFIWIFNSFDTHSGPKTYLNVKYEIFNESKFVFNCEMIVIINIRVLLCIILYIIIIIIILPWDQLFKSKKNSK